jgi:hypothetical protein
MRPPALSLLVLVGALASCNSPSSPPPPLPPPAPPTPAPAPAPVGACNNVDARDATCSGFTVMRTPQPTEPGTAIYDVTVTVAAQGQSFPITMHLLVPVESGPDLERYYGGHAPVPCSAVLVRPPCNPAASGVSIPSMPTPPYARAQFY